MSNVNDVLVLLDDFLKKETKIDPLITTLKKKLPIITDMGKLISYRDNTSPDSEPRKLIEAKMAEVLKEKLPSITDMGKLISYRDNTSPDSEPRKLIEAKMAEVLKSIANMNKLISYWDNTFPGLGPEKLIEARMREILKEVSLDSIPEWFKNVLKNGISLVPGFLHDLFIKKSEGLQKALLAKVS